ncbi:Rossmann-like and DUF2520 domain-containing protein [Leucobacter chromiiresistens]|uniref:DUF2520 domain-containing protein n=1 Tax=Leucobacter chromiiresistens TaxID=1079994 RepID=A0A147ELV1_9MICO|nr:Rossmann-like and DUF2520 domain-containing protein [Leucobacter chromiiresistens]KTR85381.1 hypothetical protein NS354_09595 [Leucobacter chromiiresistens]
MRIQIVGAGRMGRAIDRALREAEADVLPIGGRGADGAGADLVLLAVPDAAIPDAAARIAPGPIVGHLSGITPLGAVGARESCSLHPLLSAADETTRFDGAWAAVDGSTAAALQAATGIAERLGMRTFRVRDEDRAAYHASASIAANFLVVLEATAERIAATAGVPREALAPLARGALANWERLGPTAALTGPVVRGDLATIALQREALAERDATSGALYDAMVEASRALIGSRGATAEGVA